MRAEKDEKAPALFIGVSGAADEVNSRQNDARTENTKHGRGGR
jgi:hypothetical protein